MYLKNEKIQIIYNIIKDNEGITTTEILKKIQANEEQEIGFEFTSEGQLGRFLKISGYKNKSFRKNGKILKGYFI